MSKKTLAHCWLFLLIVMSVSAIFYLHSHNYLSFATLKQYHRSLQYWTSEHYFLTVIIYIAIYILIVALSVPGAIFLTLLGGFLFGPIATIYVIFSATLGSMIIFLIVRSALGEWLAKKARGWMRKMEQGFQQDAFNYILVLRLIPIFPFWVINIVSALFNVRLFTFAFATLLGIIPGSVVYVMVGNGFGKLLALDQTPNLKIIFAPSIFIPLLGLSLLALLPIIYKKFKKRKM